MTSSALVDTNVFSIISSYQDGLPQDLQERMAERFLPAVFPAYEEENRLFYWPEHARLLKSFPDGRISKAKLCVLYRDLRFALHLAIAEGEVEIVNRFCQHAPQLVTADALHCAVNFRQYQLVYWLFQWLKREDPDLVNDAEFDCDLFSFQESKATRWAQDMEWYFCLDALGIRLPFKRGNTLQRNDVAKFMRKVQLIQMLMNKDSYTNPPLKCTCAELKLVWKYLVMKNKWTILKQLAKLGDIKLLEAALDGIPRSLEHEGTTATAAAFLSAAEAGHVHVLEWLEAKFGEQGKLEFLKNIIEHGHVPVFKWFVAKHDLPSNEDNFWTSMQQYLCVGNIEIVECLYELGHAIDKANPLSLEVAQFFHRRGVQMGTNYIHAICGGISNKYTEDMQPSNAEALQMVQFYYDSYPSFRKSKEYFRQAIQNGALAIFQYAHERDLHYDIGEYDLQLAIQFNQVDIVKYLHEVVGLDLPVDGLQWAIIPREGSRVDEMDFLKSPMLEYLVASGKEVEWYMVGNDLAMCTYDTLVWLISECKYSNSWPWFKAATRFGSVEILQDLENRFQVSSKQVEAALDYAIAMNYVNLLPYLWTLFISRCAPTKQALEYECQRVLALIHQGEGPFNGPWNQIKELIGQHLLHASV